MKQKTILVLLTSVALLFRGYGQKYTSHVIIQGVKNIVLSTNKMEAQGKLSTGEIIRSGCNHGACFFQIIYKGRNIVESVGENFDAMKIYEYDFGGDGDKELVVVIDQQKIGDTGDYNGETTLLHIYHYSKGILQQIFEKEIMYYKTIIKKNYIEYYMPSGLDAAWNYYNGAFVEMNYSK